MSLNLQTMLLVVLGLTVVYAGYSAHMLKDRIYCTFRRKDKTRIEKWAKANQSRIDFDNGWYYLNPRRTTLTLVTKGIHAIIPIWARCLDFRHDSSQALDPDTFTNAWESPEARKALNKEEDIRAYQQGNLQAIQGKQKKGMLEQFMPLLVVVGFLIVGYMVWTLTKKTDQLGLGLNVLQQMMMDSGLSK